MFISIKTRFLYSLDWSDSFSSDIQEDFIYYLITLDSLLPDTFFVCTQYKGRDVDVA